MMSDKVDHIASKRKGEGNSKLTGLRSSERLLLDFERDVSIDI